MTYNAYIVAVFAPLLSFLVIGILGNTLGKRLSGILAVLFMAFSALSAWHIFSDVLRGDLITHTITLLTWIHVGNFNVDWQLYFDPLTATMVMVVTTVSFLVHLYSIGYMSHDKAVPRFMAYLGFFTFAMLMLVTSANLIQLFLVGKVWGLRLIY